MMTDLFYIDQDGVVRWKKKTAPKSKIKPGDIAGSDYGNGYFYVKLFGKRVACHHIAWEIKTGEIVPDGFEIDHINHIKHDNSPENIRLVTKPENQKNLSKAKNNTSGFTGVQLHKKSGKFQARIKVDGKVINLGYYFTAEMAAEARIQANAKYGFHENHGA